MALVNLSRATNAVLIDADMQLPYDLMVFPFFDNESSLNSSSFSPAPDPFYFFKVSREFQIRLSNIRVLVVILLCLYTFMRTHTYTYLITIQKYGFFLSAQLFFTTSDRTTRR